MRHLWKWAGLAAAAWSMAAWAQEDAPPPAPPPQDAPVIVQQPAQPQQPGVGGTGTAGVTVNTAPQTVVVQQNPTAQSAVVQQNPFTISVMGGVEGYTGNLASQINPGGTYGLQIAAEPLQFLGVELGYSGGVANLKNTTTTTGPDIIRNGGYIDATPGLTAWLNPTGSVSLKPYLLGGIGLDRYDMENNAPSHGFSSQTDGQVPFGAGLELRAMQFVANARFNYDYEFGNQISPLAANPLRYQGQLLLGGAF